MHKLKQIQIFQYETRFPRKNELFFKKLDNNSKKLYLSMYSLYSSFLYQFLIEKLGLKEYDDNILNNPIKYQPVKDDNMDIYQYLGSNYLKYIYIRNNLYIERLRNNELMFLKDKLNSNNIVYDLETKEFIENSYKRVILENIDNKNNLNINYGPISPDFVKPDNAIIIGIRFDDYYKEEGENDIKWSQELDDKLFQLDMLIDYMNIKMNESLDIPCFVVKYNDFSIIKHNKNEEIEILN